MSESSLQIGSAAVSKRRDLSRAGNGFFAARPRHRHSERKRTMQAGAEILDLGTPVDTGAR